jgi:hypothetical protein
MKAFKFTIGLAVVITTLVACSGNDNAMPQGEHGEAYQPIEKVMAKVDGTVITDLDLQVAIDSTFGRRDGIELSANQKQKLLKSIVASRAIARVSEKELPAEVMVNVERQVQAFRDQLLVKKYMARYAVLQPVTHQMVQDYYNAHPDKFGAKTIRSFEMVFSPDRLDAKKRDALLKALNDGQRHKDWQRWSQQMKKSGHDIQFRKGQVGETSLHADLRRVVKPLDKGDVSNVSFVDGRAYLIRITDEVKISPQPLTAVSTRIRKALLPIQLKAAISQVSDEAMKKVDVTYVNAIEGENS